MISSEAGREIGILAVTSTSLLTSGLAWRWIIPAWRLQSNYIVMGNIPWVAGRTAFGRPIPLILEYSVDA
jgi:hypothetical protein